MFTSKGLGSSSSTQVSCLKQCRRGTNKSLEPFEHFLGVEGKIILQWSPKHHESWAWHSFNNMLQKHGIGLGEAIGGILLSRERRFIDKSLKKSYSESCIS